MEVKKIEEKFILEYIRDTLKLLKSKRDINMSDFFHHNSSYESSPSIVKRGILSLEDQVKKGAKSYTEDILKIMDDTTSHINGSDGISLARMGLKDLKENEDEYNPYNTWCVDFLIKQDIRAARVTRHYGNEYISFSPIKQSSFVSIDVRFLKYMDKMIENHHSMDFTDLVNRYNRLIMIAEEIIKRKLEIPLREMSYIPQEINVKKLANSPRLVLK